MTTYVLIWLFFTASGVTSGTQEFVTLDACKTAAYFLIDAAPSSAHNMQVKCLPKESSHS